MCPDPGPNPYFRLNWSLGSHAKFLCYTQRWVLKFPIAVLQFFICTASQYSVIQLLRSVGTLQPTEYVSITTGFFLLLCPIFTMKPRISMMQIDFFYKSNLLLHGMSFMYLETDQIVEWRKRCDKHWWLTAGIQGWQSAEKKDVVAVCAISCHHRAWKPITPAFWFKVPPTFTLDIVVNIVTNLLYRSLKKPTLQRPVFTRRQNSTPEIFRYSFNAMIKILNHSVTSTARLCI